MNKAEEHNELAFRLVSEIVSFGDDPKDALILLESVAIGVLLFLVKTGGDEIVTDRMFKHIKDRMKKARQDGTFPSQST